MGPTISTRARALPLLLLAAALGAGCAGAAGTRGGSPGGVSPRLHHLLDLEDARAPVRELEPFLRDPDPEVRARAALAAGRLASTGSGVAEAAAALRTAARDPEARVREAVALAVGLTGNPDLAAEALAMARRAGAGTEERARAAFAAVALAGDLAWKEEGFAGLFEDGDPVVRRRAFRSLVGAVRGWKEPPGAVPGWLARAFDGAPPDPEVQFCGALAVRTLLRAPGDGALRADGPAGGLPALLTRIQAAALGSPDPDVRSACALALGAAAGEGTGGLEGLLAAEPVARVRVSLVRGLAGRGAAGAAALGEALRTDPAFGVRAAAAQGLAAVKAAAAVPDLVVAAASDPSRLVRVEALAALHALGGPGAARAVEEAVGSPDPFLRAAAAGDLLGMDALARLVRDPEVRVREAAVDAAGGRGREGLALCLDALRDPDPVVAALAAGHLGSMGAAEARGALREALGRFPVPPGAPDPGADLRAAALEALGTLKSADARALAEAHLGDPDPSVRAAAAGVLEGLDGARPEVPRFPRLRPFPDRGSLSVAEEGAPRIRFETDRGSFLVRTLPSAAPVHVARLLARVRAGGYDGTIFHRIVPNFVDQGGDPRGDGSGNGGSSWRQEFHAVPYRRGTLGVPRSAPPDSGGCQLFFCHGETPHLDQRYTVTGEVVGGWEVLDRLDLGDRILRARVE